MNKTSILDLFDEKVGHVCARYDAIAPLGLFAKNLVAPCSRAIQ